MTTKTLIITPQGTAREIHSIGEKPNQLDDKYTSSQNPWWQYREDLNAWQSIEDSLEEYKIDNESYCGSGEMFYGYDNTYLIKAPAGSIHRCEVNEVDKTAIIL